MWLGNINYIAKSSDFTESSKDSKAKWKILYMIHVSTSFYNMFNTTHLYFQQSDVYMPLK